jgi:hypothetical protein
MPYGWILAFYDNGWGDWPCVVTAKDDLTKTAKVVFTDTSSAFNMTSRTVRYEDLKEQKGKNTRKKNVRFSRSLKIAEELSSDLMKRDEEESKKKEKSQWVHHQGDLLSLKGQVLPSQASSYSG